jgi:hypothetical protein
MTIETLVLCLQQIHQPTTREHHRSLRTQGPRIIRSKLGPLWKLMYVVEPMPHPSGNLLLRDEKNELLILDGPFAETKA